MRSYDAASQTAANAASLGLVQFVEMVFDSGTLRLCTGGHSYTWGSQTWTALHHIGRIESLEESAGLEVHPLKFTLSGVDVANVGLALSEPIQGRRCRIYLGYTDNDHQLVADPAIVWSGRLDTMQIASGAEAVIQVSAVSKLADWERARVRRYSDADQKSEHPGDRGLEFVAATVDKELVWGTF